MIEQSCYTPSRLPAPVGRVDKPRRAAAESAFALSADPIRLSPVDVQELASGVAETLERTFGWAGDWVYKERADAVEVGLRLADAGLLTMANEAAQRLIAQLPAAGGIDKHPRHALDPAAILLGLRDLDPRVLRAVLRQTWTVTMRPRFAVCAVQHPQADASTWQTALAVVLGYRSWGTVDREPLGDVMAALAGHPLAADLDDVRGAVVDARAGWLRDHHGFRVAHCLAARPETLRRCFRTLAEHLPDAAALALSRLSRERRALLTAAELAPLLAADAEATRLAGLRGLGEVALPGRPRARRHHARS